MSNNNKKEELIKKADIQKIADKGKAVYEAIKADYDPKEKGKFLAIDVDTKNVYLGETSAEAVESAKRKHPDAIFYVVKIGYDYLQLPTFFVRARPHEMATHTGAINPYRKA